MRFWILTGLACLVASATSATECLHTELPKGFVYLSEVEATINQDMRYATQANFTGAPVDGYEANACILTRATAEALAGAQRDLVSQDPKLTLKVYDCYRPARAVLRFRDWMEKPDENSRSYYHPNIERHDLIKLGYISSSSGHSRGNAVDITIANSGKVQNTPGTPTRLPTSCAAPQAEREIDTSLDMGTAFDCFDQKSQTFAQELTGEILRARGLLVNLMTHHGFRNYPKEWWHFSYPPGDSGASFDFVVRAPCRGQ